MKAEILRLEGVGILLISSKSTLYVVEEMESKPFIQKERGMLSFPLETIEEDETPLITLRRLMTDEVGTIEVDNFEQLQSFEFTHPACRVTIHMYIARVKQEFIAAPADNDVIYHGWMTPTELLGHRHKRVEVNPIVSAYRTLV